LILAKNGEKGLVTTDYPSFGSNYLALVENSIEGMLVADVNARIIYANPPAGNILNYAKEELLNLELSSFVFPGQRAETLRKFQDTLRGLKTPEQHETLFTDRQGQCIPVLLSMTKTYWQNGPGVFLAFYDITERKRAEEELRDNEQKFANLISNLPGMVYRCRRDHDSMLFVSAGAYDLTGFLPEELIKRSYVSYAGLIHPDDRGRVHKVINQCLGNQRPWRLEYRIQQKDRKERWVWEQGSGVFDEEGRLKHLEGFITDITESKRTEENLRRTEERRTRAEQLAYVGELAARLNHEIKNPLATIRTGIELINRSLEAKDENRVILDTVVSEIQNVNQLVSGLLSAAAIDHFQTKAVVLQNLVQEVAMSFEPLGRAQKVKLEMDSPEESIVISFDTKAFRRFFGNLVINAFDVLEPGGLVRVSLKLMSDGEIDQLFTGFSGQVVALSVSDNGPGIPRDQLDQVFLPFYTTKNKGTGLGLSIAHDIIEAQGGVLQAASEPGKGACFTAYLPVGDRPPCYTLLPEKKDACHNCQVADNDLCWLKHKVECSFGLGGLRDCMDCPVYKRYNLNYYAAMLEPEVSKCKVPYFWWTMNSI
jgi:PAS domain S-box-containing protein